MSDELARALILMLNAIRLQLFAQQMTEPSEELRECLKASAFLADQAMIRAALVDKIAATERVG